MIATSSDWNHKMMPSDNVSLLGQQSDLAKAFS
jgi:hypothetical protein